MEWRKECSRYSCENSKIFVSMTNSKARNTFLCNAFFHNVEQGIVHPYLVVTYLIRTYVGRGTSSFSGCTMNHPVVTPFWITSGSRT